jgi:glycine/D-amino acid oxidase-like deaminating enzyme
MHISYWEAQSFTAYHHIVIGGGIVGMSVALELKELYPKQEVLILERGLLPSGASTRNAGFACMGSPTELLDDLQTMSEAEVLHLFALRKNGLDSLRARLGEAAIDFRAEGSYELLSADELYANDKLDYLNSLVQPITKGIAFKRVDDKISRFGFSAAYTQGLIENCCEGSIDSGKMMRALTTLCISKGIEIRTGAVVSTFEEQAHDVKVWVEDPFRKTGMTFSCQTLSICTNAFAKTLLPDEDIVPGRGQVLVTAPIPGLKFKGIYHFDKGFYYFRELHGRILFGGGRNKDINREATTAFDLNEDIQKDLEQKLQEIIIPATPFKVVNRWAGIMAFGQKKLPIVKAISPKVFAAVRMGGMGVALAAQAALQLKAIIKERH